MFKTIRNAFKVKELRGKILYTFMMLVVIRFGCQLPIPGIETSFFANWFAKQTTDEPIAMALDSRSASPTVVYRVYS